MGSPSEEDPFFTTLLQSGGEGCTPTYEQYSSVMIQTTPLHGEKRPPPKKVQRGASFTVEEDNLLVSGWLNISIDAIRGTDQKSTQMWDRISEFYHEYKKPNTANRSIGSLINRWSMIQKCTNKFCAFLAQVESLHPSGATEHDKIEKAKIMYKEIEKGNFTVEHCWCQLRHQPKWQQHMNNLNTRRKPPDKRPANEQSFEVPDDVVEENVERPPGKKLEKDNLRKRKAQEACDVDFNSALEKMTADRRLFMGERRAWVTKADEVKGAQLELDKRKFEAEIMSKDLSNMTVMQQAYFLNIQKKIYEDSLNNSEGTFDTSPSIPHGGV
ncbi:glutathione S-transferase T3-like [Juglans microcarpa x Juglans regia]|uniref:glutathione S-transferase T3-like n=1 Tax=Juglans microcarpa x Juglans regia TaxID=2249226 RepID=UPI001B7EED66|nr:glutathione S-transferase T3-like [Juglans microcarpa x Juglans regia]XP_040992698.1 glutathione S-transferase T3-like [Juglans microcarpa x Juglans regia]XP_040997060.1 glutathione S-transferase T3-like [Juglans microcarpa x Juglans regia]XP_041009512.1 glutathione S-transferase T3-like [Juglans microcarpa x Juglans regia]XP_041020389.1 glutathione S-transferase T3-like [Juglans microcarpa x Juglans regia]XP_041025294.1 glutathione S-transferase T3-like [Juglans microcarpa x Juglans regia]